MGEGHMFRLASGDRESYSYILNPVKTAEEVPKNVKDGRVDDLKTWEPMLQRCQKEVRETWDTRQLCKSPFLRAWALPSKRSCAVCVRRKFEQEPLACAARAADLALAFRKMGQMQALWHQLYPGLVVCDIV